MKAWLNLGVLLACVLPGFMPVFGATNTVNIINFDFVTPQTATHVDPVIEVGDTVTWVWSNGTHSTTAAAGQLESWDSTLHATPFTFSHTFQNVGTFGYFCLQHGANGGCGKGSGMSGKVIVMSPVGEIAARVTGVALEGDGVRVTWITGGLCKTNALQRVTVAGNFTTNFADLFVITNTASSVTNFLDASAAAGITSQFYRVRLVQ